MIGRGESFQYKDFSANEWTHVWIVVTTPNGPSGSALAFNITEVQSYTQDRSCLLNPGDHPKITLPSVINYGEHGRPQKFPMATMASGPNILTFPAVSSVVLTRIHEGALATSHIERKFLLMLKAELGL